MPPRFGRIGDWSNDDDRDEQSDENNGKRESWFAGGERSGISVQNPNRQRGDAAPGGTDLVRELLRRAAERSPSDAEEPSTSGGFSVFSGGGHTLGSDDVPSTYIADPNAPEEDEVVVRTITFWQDGFQIEDGDLMRYDDPEDAKILSELTAGTAPISLLNVRQGQPVELRMIPRQGEMYTPPAGVRAFRGAGQRLGAPVPQIASGNSGQGAPSGSNSMPGTFPGVTAPAAAASSSASTTERESLTTRFEVDQSRPTTSIQLRLADGTRMVCRMNLTHTIGDIRNFINAARPENVTRPYTIGTTFPNRTLEDNSATIESAGLVNSVVVQRWM
ncbi:hypothetical protein Agabi119p4_10248 [Agaricus bisporus var. burnettii]|uniref:SEP-domain-containing protein n=1 Tax=Agaricus bisporus var. burnettii TaxID=192524 RepID=A0A8H7EW88_AGABI|nr:hypothetical protein Agabi119p4_10248 [Agaricus bisporus var. burnettii]